METEEEKPKKIPQTLWDYDSVDYGIRDYSDKDLNIRKYNPFTKLAFDPKKLTSLDLVIKNWLFFLLQSALNSEKAEFKYRSESIKLSYYEIRRFLKTYYEDYKNTELRHNWFEDFKTSITKLKQINFRILNCYLPIVEQIVKEKEKEVGLTKDQKPVVINLHKENFFMSQLFREVSEAQFSFLSSWIMFGSKKQKDQLYFEITFPKEVVFFVSVTRDYTSQRFGDIFTFSNKYTYWLYELLLEEANRAIAKTSPSRKQSFINDDVLEISASSLESAFRIAYSEKKSSAIEVLSDLKRRDKLEEIKTVFPNFDYTYDKGCKVLSFKGVLKRTD